jgi:prepilin-type N-terminal cleavage/methylation domain-containing protein
MRRRATRQAFTLIELMVTVAITGVLSAIAIPSFAKMIARSKTAETSANLSAMFKSAAAYYASERAAQGDIASVSGHCTVDDAGPSPATPGRFKRPFTDDPSFRALGFNIAEQVYFSYGYAAVNGVSSCDHAPSSAELYTFYAHGDLDGDSTLSTFELPAASDSANLLYHSVGIYIDQETE